MARQFRQTFYSLHIINALLAVLLILSMKGGDVKKGKRAPEWVYVVSGVLIWAAGEASFRVFGPLIDRRVQKRIDSKERQEEQQEQEP